MKGGHIGAYFTKKNSCSFLQSKFRHTLVCLICLILLHLNFPSPFSIFMVAMKFACLFDFFVAAASAVFIIISVVLHVVSNGSGVATAFVSSYPSFPTKKSPMTKGGSLGQPN